MSNGNSAMELAAQLLSSMKLPSMPSRGQRRRKQYKPRQRGPQQSVRVTEVEEQPLPECERALAECNKNIKLLLGRSQAPAVEAKFVANAESANGFDDYSTEELLNMARYTPTSCANTENELRAALVNRGVDRTIVDAAIQEGRKRMAKSVPIVEEVD
jgi:hypothetical protein